MLPLMRTATSVALACAVLGAPAPALAEKVVEAQTVWRFDASEYMLDQGEVLTFKNADTASPGPHNVTATDKGPDGKPLFASETIGNGKQAPVGGAQQLAAGSYDFICTVHPFMAATLVVSDRGAPSTAPPPAAPPADTTAPKVRSSLARSSLRTALRRGHLVAVLASDERVTLRLALVARLHGRTVTLGRADAAGRSLHVAIRLSPAGRRALRGLKRATVTLLVEARDDAGNLTAKKASRTLRR
jgi:plastocyanin